jgi:hypothetical protein
MNDEVYTASFVATLKPLLHSLPIAKRKALLCCINLFSKSEKISIYVLSFSLSVSACRQSGLREINFYIYQNNPT